MESITHNDKYFETEVLTKHQLKHCVEILESIDKENPPFLSEVIRSITGDPKQSARTAVGREIKRFFESVHEIALSKKHIYERRTDDFVITREHVSAIRNNLNRINKPLELAKIVFNNKDISPFHIEYRALKKYLDTEMQMHTSQSYLEFEDDEFDEKYTPPTTPLGAFREAKKFIRELNTISEDQFPKTRFYHWMCQLKDYLHDHHFLYHININIKKPSKRELFLSTYIKYVYNKPDLLEEEKEQYITLCTEIILIDDSYQTLLDLNKKISEIIDDEEQSYLKNSLIEHKKDISKTHHDAKMRLEKLEKSLNGSRAERIKRQGEQRMSLVQLINYWKEEENRERMIKYAEIRAEQVKKAAQDLSSCDSLVAEIWGMGTIEDILGS